LFFVYVSLNSRRRTEPTLIGAMHILIFFPPLVPFCCISTPFPLASLPSHAWSGKTRRAEICRLTMGAELVVQAFFAPFPPTASASLASRLYLH
uniref:Uncharacterized protein n=1 Tax=Takifugu rubripes TaxID=31033 RepID=A0A674NUU2_TAKRU